MNEDILDLLREFIAHDVRFLLVGAHAVSYYSEPRSTGDLDLLIDPEPSNAARAYRALASFGAPLLDLTLEDLTVLGTVYQIGVAPYRIDVMTELSGVSFAEAWKDRQRAHLGDLEIPVIGYKALVENKKATGRAKDLLDLEMLSKHREQ